MRDRCLALYAEDKILEAARLEHELKRTFPDVHVASKEALRPIRAIGEDVERFHNEFGSEEGWTCVRRGSGPSDITFWMRKEPGNALHTFRIEGEFEAPAEFLLVLMKEITLYETWLPFIGGSKELAAPSRCEHLAWIQFPSPAPSLIHHRDCCIHTRAIDCLDEDGCVFILMQSSEGCDSEPELEPYTKRISVKFGAIEVFPITQGRTRLRAITLLDPKISVLPTWLLNWLTTRVCYLGVRKWENEAQKLMQDNNDENPHRVRMKEDPIFYSWLIPRIRSRFNTLSSDFEEVEILSRR